MPHAIHSVDESKPFVRPRGAPLRPLEVRFQEAVAKLQKVKPGHPVDLMLSERSLDHLEDLIKFFTPAPAPIDPNFKAESAKFYQLKQTYYTMACEVTEKQKELWRTRDYEIHQLLGDVTEDLFVKPRQVELSVNAPGPENYAEAREAYQELWADYLALEKLRHRLVETLNVSSSPPEVVNRLLINKQAQDIAALRATIAKQSEHITSLENRTDRLKLKLTPRISKKDI